MLKKLKFFIWPLIFTVVLITILAYLITIGVIEHDFGKAISGTFIGAWLAFLSNMFMRFQNQYRDDVAADRRALFTVRSQLDDFINYRYAFQITLASLDKAMPNAPECFLAKPMGFNFNPANVYDFKSLGFLLSTSIGRRSYEYLQLTERTYLDFMARHTDLNNSATDFQKEMSQLNRNLAGFLELPLNSVESHLSPELVARGRDHLRAVALRIDRDEQRYQNAFKLLNDALRDILGDDTSLDNFEIPSKFRQANLPLLPQSLRSYLDQIPNDNKTE